jgi:uncharacterized protein (DUF1778 family)
MNRTGEKTEQIHLRVTPEEARLIMEIASQKGVTMSAHILNSAIPNYAKRIKKAS